MTRFPRPDRARLGDTIPFFWDGTFHIFFLMRYADDTHDAPETEWGHYTTTDFVDFHDHGVAIPRSADPRAADHSAATGSVVRIGDEFVAYYTGFSDWQRRHGGRDQTVLRARSNDLMTWRKDPDFRLAADASLFDPHEWRDPFVSWDEETHRYRMLVTARGTTGPVDGRGIIAQAWSHDGLAWNIDPEPFWAPRSNEMLECPDLFPWGSQWYLIYSTVGERAVTRYRTAPTPSGPWSAPTDDELDGLGFYAGKTVSDTEGRRYLVGWAPNTLAGKDGAPWLWGGNLIAHQMVAEIDGTIAVRRPAVVEAAYQGRETPVAVGSKSAILDAPFSRVTRTLGDLPATGRIDLTTTFSPHTREFGLVLRTSDDERHGYRLRVQPTRRRLIVDRVDRPGNEAPYDVRFFEPRSGGVAWSIDFDGELATAYLNDCTAVTLRGYDRSASGLTAYAVDGAIAVEDVHIWSREEH